MSNETEQYARSSESLMERVEKLVDSRINAQVTAAVDKLKLWIVVGLLSNLIPAIFLAYQIGQFTSTVKLAGVQNESQQAALDQNQVWMRKREIWEQAIESWAVPQGFNPPRDRSNKE